MTTPTKLALEEQRARLERRANVIRARLLRTIDVLDERRHQVREIGSNVRRLAVPVAASLLGIALAAAGTAFAVYKLVERRREKRLGVRFQRALAPFRKEVKPPLWKEVLRRVTLTMVGVLATAAAKRGVYLVATRALPALPAPGPVLPPAAFPPAVPPPAPLLGA